MANRVQKIKGLTNTQHWHHVSTKGNPADLASRGQSLSQLPDSNWLTGPDWLWKTTFDAPVYSKQALSQQDPEVRIILQSRTTAPFDIDLRLQHISKWTKARRVIARILKLAGRKESDNKGLTPEDLHKATRFILSSIQS